LFGRILLDEYGQTQRLSVGWEGDAPLEYVADVAYWNDIREALPGLVCKMSIHGIAPADKICPVCWVGWGLKNAMDVVMARDELMHEVCASLRAEKAEQEQYRSILERTPFFPFPVEYVENKYWGKDAAPWVRVKTPWGGIVMGWRKRVINLTWSDTKCDVGDAFEAEDVTKGPHMIHAWSVDKAIEYLTTLHELLTAPVPPPTT